MPAVLRACFAVLACFALAACDNSPTFDASSLPAYQKSLNDIKATLSPRDQERLDLALLTTAIGGPPNRAVKSSLEGVAYPIVYLDRLRSRIDGRTAAKVIELTAADLDFAIAQAERQSSDGSKILAAIKVENPQYHWDRTRNGDGPTIHFSVVNGTSYALSTITVSGVLTLHGRTLLAAGGLIHVFSSPLQPGAQELVTVVPDFTSQWRRPDLEADYDADFTLKVANIVDTNRRRLLSVDADIVEAMKRERDVLRSN
jgi:hypothetical protein